MKTRTHQDVQAWPEAEEEQIYTKGQWGIARGVKLFDRLLLGSFERQWEPSQSRQAIVREVRRSLLVRLHSDRTWSQRGSGNTASLDSRSTLLRVVFHFIFLPFFPSLYFLTRKNNLLIILRIIFTFCTMAILDSPRPAHPRPPLQFCPET